MPKGWYSPKEIRFSKPTALWLIQNLGYFWSGRWPPEPSNYIGIPGKKSRHTAYFATPIEYAAEIEERLEKCGRDGLILLAIECWGMSEESMSKYFGLQVWSIGWKADRALAYVSSGQVRRWHDTKKRPGKDYQTFKDSRGKK